jgi:hypothetical protein
VAVAVVVAAVAAVVAVPRSGIHSMRLAPMQSHHHVRTSCSHRLWEPGAVEAVYVVDVRSSVLICCSAAPWADWLWY